MKKRIKNRLLIFISLIVISCSEDETNSNVPVQPDIYIAGKTKYTPTVWRDGSATYLTDGTYNAEATSITVVNNDEVYVTGFETKDIIKKATLWKNGNAIDLSTTPFTSIANAVAVVNDDVYVAGYEYESTKNTFVAKVWKNGIPTSISNGNHDAYATSIAVDNDDVYVTGHEYINYTDVATLWINGVPTRLTDGENPSKAYSVVIENNDVYVAGYEFYNGNFHAKLWKNGVMSSFTDETKPSIAYSVAVENNTVYIAGYEDTAAMLWINGEAHPLSGGHVLGNQANSVALNKNDVYVVGHTYDDDGLRNAKLWKNGEPSNVTDNTDGSYALSIDLH
ncbi:hypothetical protein FF125_11730 [Aureibaculum algae]|uniref:Uncharacterized protein n=1 Tax=Aureibaculum algae TaxID=2584122 RepID=A0A5B7TUS0_9FLAO|nr:hypothetical protein [Aureibaculum algae]QCX39071.1 hypothetical protein FF125_11730 [Aureibaculum algae]